MQNQRPKTYNHETLAIRAGCRIQHRTEFPCTDPVAGSSSLSMPGRVSGETGG